MTRALRLLSVVGTRPEAIKMAPVALAAADRADVEHILLATGQHGAMCHDALAHFGVMADERLGLSPYPDTLAGAEQAIEAAMRARLAADPPDLLLVQGDTTSALAAARAAVRAGVPLGHVEAGLRSFDFAHPFPEERNRVEIDGLADLLFAPTPDAAANLAADPAVWGDVIVTGNTGIDALLLMRSRVVMPPANARRLLLVTCHRRENIGAGVASICAAIRRLAARGDVRVLLPLHCNPAVRSDIERRLGGTPHVALVEPLPYPEMVAALASAHVVLTDSGGVQEEAATLGAPALVLRETTERGEGVATGNLVLAGTDPDRVVALASQLLDDDAVHAAMRRRDAPFGRGGAAERILNACLAWRQGGSSLPPPAHRAAAASSSLSASTQATRPSA